MRHGKTKTTVCCVACHNVINWQLTFNNRPYECIHVTVETLSVVSLAGSNFDAVVKSQSQKDKNSLSILFGNCIS